LLQWNQYHQWLNHTPKQGVELEKHDSLPQIPHGGSEQIWFLSEILLLKSAQAVYTMCAKMYIIKGE